MSTPLHPAPNPSAQADLGRRAVLTRTARTAVAALTTLAAAALVGACASKPEVRTDRDPKADLNAYKTYAIHHPQAAMPGAPAAPAALPMRPPMPGARSGYTTLHEARLEQAARAQLERHGFVPVAEDPDLRVHLTLKVVNRQELHSTPGARTFVGYRTWGGTQIDTVDVRQGTLVVDLVDARRNALVWRGVAAGHLDRSDASDPGPAIDRAVAEVFATFKR
ncbi:MAG: DUF4136 domain-containing protein [Burkholderiales bacterium]|nr:DUF4136 domain-containing protein [Burkholderiales bacterium]